MDINHSLTHIVVAYGSKMVCSFSTGIGVDTTAREAEHQYVCTSIFPKIGQIRTTEEVVKLLTHP